MTHACDSLIPLLLRAADDEPLAPADRATLDTHLAACAACAEALTGQRAMRAALRELQTAPATSVGTRVLATLREERGAGLAGVFDALDWKRWTWRLVPVAAALAVAVASVSQPQVEAAVEDGIPASSALVAGEVSATDLLSLLLSAGPDQTVPAGGAGGDQ